VNNKQQVTTVVSLGSAGTRPTYTSSSMYCTESTITLLLRTYPSYVFPVTILVFDQPLKETTRFLEHADT